MARTQEQQLNARTQKTQGGYRKAGAVKQGKRKLNTPYATQIRDIPQRNNASTTEKDPQCTKKAEQNTGNPTQDIQFHDPDEQHWLEMENKR